VNPQDSYFERAQRDLYRMLPQGRALNAIEQAALLPLCAKYWHRGLADRDTAAVPELREGVAHLVKLSVERVEAYALAYRASEAWTQQQFTFPADA